MKKLIILSLGILITGCSLYSETIVVNDFDSCVAVGNPIMDSFPEQCSHAGNIYVNESQKAVISDVLEVPENCLSWFDGCNNCMVGKNGDISCTRKFCPPEMMQEPQCVSFEDDPSVADMKICTMEYAPVCGVDGKTYGNKCGAGEVEISHEGECE